MSAENPFNPEELSMPEQLFVQSWFDIQGPTKTYNFCISVDRSKQTSDEERVYVAGTLILNNEQLVDAPTVRSESTQLMLTAVRQGLDVALREQLPFNWFFTPTDYDGKMKQWEERYITSGILKPSVPLEDIPAYIQTVDQLLAEASKEQPLTPKLNEVADQQSHSMELSDRRDRINAVHKSK